MQTLTSDTDVLDEAKMLERYLSATDVVGISLVTVQELIKENKVPQQTIQKQQQEINEIKNIKAEIELLKNLNKIIIL